MISEKRFIHSRLSTRHIPDLLQAIFVAELISPSRDIWIISPWISDIPVIDNQTNRFQHLARPNQPPLFESVNSESKSHFAHNPIR